MARTFYAQNLDFLHDMIPDMDTVQDDEGNNYRSTYIGSALNLDPCGRYHHILSPNGLTNRCINFWESLEKAANRLNGWIESGEGDPLDTFFCMPADDMPADDSDQESE